MMTQLNITKAGKVEANPFQLYVYNDYLGELNDDSSLLKGGRLGRLYKSSASGLSH
jgi:hypothetical protein